MPPKANLSEKSDDDKLLIAVFSLLDPLPPIDNHKLGALLGIKPELLPANNKAGDDVKVEQATAALGNSTGDKTSADAAGIEQAAAVLDNKKRCKSGGRKRAAATEGPNEPPAQRKKIDKPIGISLNASTSKLRTGKGRKSNKDKKPLEGLGVVKQEYGRFEIGMQ
ncbi:uncharacterized protein EAF01_004683 [Botrytis porri]|uniref:uncharacterized protein n=1 Tax=Botrytis porri TaxID=87229 RepID=UPI0019003DA8|nr:uncharacterized protein EAF01_004683 [Botrytis porri]KAF7907096.1 hypothetical protein EAF01_004683 [Botrytis porri]